MIIAIAMNDYFADNGPNIVVPKDVGGTFKDIFPPFYLPEPDRKPMGFFEESFRAMLEKERQRTQPCSNPATETVDYGPSDRECVALSSLAKLLADRYQEPYQVSYTLALVPTFEPDFFTKGETFTRATFVITNYDKELYLHIDFKATVEIYIIHRYEHINTERRLFNIDRPDSLAMFRIITTELERVINGDFKNESKAEA